MEITFKPGATVLYEGRAYTVTGEWRGYLCLRDQAKGTTVKASASDCAAKAGS